MNDNKYLSRKFLVSAAAFLLTFGATFVLAWTNRLTPTWVAAVPAIIAPTLGPWIVVQGLADKATALARIVGGKPEGGPS